MLFTVVKIDKKNSDIKFKLLKRNLFMNKKPISEYSNEELLQAKKTTAVIAITLTSMLVLLLAMGIYISITKKFSALLAIPFSLSTIAIILFKKLKEITAELKNRETNESKNKTEI